MSSMEGKTVVITGAGSGIGFACAEGFLNDGAEVLGIDIKVEGLEKLAEKGAITMQADTSVDADMRAMVEKAVKETGRIDVLLNNAGAGNITRVEDFADGEFEKMMATFPDDGPTGKVYFWEREYPLFLSTIPQGRPSTTG